MSSSIYRICPRCGDRNVVIAASAIVEWREAESKYVVKATLHDPEDGARCESCHWMGTRKDLSIVGPIAYESGGSE
jgi:hypothetical protein